MTTARPTPLIMKPKAPSAVVPATRVVESSAEFAVLRYDDVPTATGNECHWLIVRAPIAMRHQKLISGAFSTEGMTGTEVGEAVVREALSYYRESGEAVRLCVPQQYGEKAFLASNDVPQAVSIGRKEHPSYTSLNRRAVTLLTMYKVRAHAELHPWHTTGEDEYKKTQQRTLYVDASMTTESGLVGAGYVIKDTYINRALNSEEWGLRFGSTATKYMRIGGNTHAELAAILSVLKTTTVLNSALTFGHQSLLIVSDSKYSIEMLNLLRYGTPVTFSGTILPSWRDTAEKILFLLHDIDVHFEWVKGHADDPLNIAADALAMATRKSIESAKRDEDDIQLHRGRIISQTVTALNIRGIKTKLFD